MATGGSSKKGKTPMTAITHWPQTKKDFLQWFWTGTNGNDLVKELNVSRPGNIDDYVRREKERPTIYCISLDDHKFPRKDGTWNLCKVGFTHAGTVQGENNRMEQLQTKIKEKYLATTNRQAEAKALFVLPIGAVDITPHFGTEKRIREAVGWAIDKNLAKKYGLPCPTEWVLTTQAFIEKIKQEKAKLTGTADPIDLFKNLKFNHPDPLPPWISFDDKHGQRKVLDFQIE